MGSYKFGKQAVASKEQSSTRTFWKVVSITLILLIPPIIYIVLTTLPPSPVTGRTIDKGTFDPYATIKTDWFSFRVEKTWQSVPELTKEGVVYTYREMQGPNPQGLLRIYINDHTGVSDIAYSRVVPITVQDGTTIIPKDMQPDCTTTAPSKYVNEFITKQGDASFKCWPGTSVLYSVAAEIGGDPKIHMKRLNSDPITYTISYRNLAFSENTDSFPRLLKTFKSL
jgi:hypothetical protein